MEEKKMIDVHVVNKNKKKYRDKDRFKYIDSYSKVHAVNRNKKKIHRFLQKKKMIDVYAVNKKNKESIQILTIEKKKNY